MAMSLEERRILRERLEVLEQQEALEAERRQVEWKEVILKRTANGDIEIPLVVMENTKAMIDHNQITVKYNEMSKDIDIDIPGFDFHADTKINNQFSTIYDMTKIHGYKISQNDLDNHIAMIADHNSYHPVGQWIVSKEWDGVDRLGQFYDTVTSPDAVKEFLMYKWGIMGVAAIFKPEGIRPQGVLTFAGKQGIRKTSWLASIVGDSHWIDDGIMLNPNDKDSVLSAVRKWIVELGEIQATFRKADIQAIKAFITKDSDTIRPAYARKFNQYQRRTIFFGTVDEAEFLQDQNGNRRFWTLNVDKVNTEHNIDLQQLWAQFKVLWDSGERFWLEQDEIEMLDVHNQAFMAIDPVWDLLEEYVEKGITGRGMWRTVTRILNNGCQMNRVTKLDKNSGANWLRKHGFDTRNDRKFYVQYKNRPKYLN